VVVVSESCGCHMNPRVAAEATMQAGLTLSTHRVGRRVDVWKQDKRLGRGKEVTQTRGDAGNDGMVVRLVSRSRRLSEEVCRSFVVTSLHHCPSLINITLGCPLQNHKLHDSACEEVSFGRQRSSKHLIKIRLIGSMVIYLRTSEVRRREAKSIPTPLLSTVTCIS
jgi:hypothetical protein